MLPIFAAALAVIAGMLVMADYARRQADQARQAQAVMERTRTLGAGIDSLTWRTLATNALNDNITKMNNGDLTAREACAQMDDLGTKTLTAGA